MRIEEAAHRMAEAVRLGLVSRVADRDTDETAPAFLVRDRDGQDLTIRLCERSAHELTRFQWERTRSSYRAVSGSQAATTAQSPALPASDPEAALEKFRTENEPESESGLEEKLAACHRLIARLTEERDDWERSADKLVASQGELAEQVVALGDVAKERDDWKEQAEAKRKVAETAGTRIAELADELSGVMEERDDLKVRLTSAQRRLREQKAQLDRQEKVTDDVVKERDGLAAQLEAAQDLLKAVAADRDQAHKRARELKMGLEKHDLANGGCVPADAYREAGKRIKKLRKQRAQLRERLAAVQNDYEQAPDCDHRQHLKVTPSQRPGPPVASCTDCGADLGSVTFEGIAATVDPRILEPKSIRGALIFYRDRLETVRSALAVRDQPHPSLVQVRDADRGLLWVRWEHDGWVQELQNP